MHKSQTINHITHQAYLFDQIIKSEEACHVFDLPVLAECVVVYIVIV